MLNRQLIATFAALALISCAGKETSTPPPTSSPTTTSTTVARLPQPVRYVPVAGEPAVEAKQVAADAAQAIGTYDLGGGTPGAAQERLGVLAAPGATPNAAALLVAPASSAVEIIYPQLGGLTETQASVMVVLRHRLLEDGEVRSATRTIDVRLVLLQEAWKVTSIESQGGDPPPIPVPLSEIATAVLVDPNIELPDSARWDIEAGRIDERIMQLLDRLADSHTLSVTVLASGHPHNVFDSESVSNHTEGRGVDIWALDGMPVVSQRDVASPLRQLVQQLLAEGVTELGSPWDLDGPTARASFTNAVHQDHLHLAYDRA